MRFVRSASIACGIVAALAISSAHAAGVEDFYNALSDDQKARFNTMGKQLFAQNSGAQNQ